MKNGFPPVCVAVWWLALRAAAAATLTWDNGAGNLTWDAGVSANWSGAAWTNGSAAVFDATGAGAIAIAGNGVTAQSLTFNAGAIGYGFSGGVLTIANNGAITNNGAGTLTFNSTMAGPAGNAALRIAGSGNLTFGGAVGTDGVSIPTLTMVGAGTLTLDGSANNPSCTVVANSGTVVLGKASAPSICAIGNGLTVGGATIRLDGTGGNQIWDYAPVTVNSGTFDFNGRSEAFNGFDGAGGTVLNSSGNSLMTIGSNNGGGTYAGTITDGGGTLAVTKLGTGVQYLTGANSYSGQTTVSGGYLVPGHNHALGTGAGGVVVHSGATLQLEKRVGADVTISNITATIAGDGIGGTRGALASWSGTNTWAGPVVLAGDSRIYIQQHAFTVSGVISGAGRALTRGGGGTLTLGGADANTYTGTTTLNGAGTYAAPSRTALSKPANVAAVGDMIMVNEDANVLYPTADNQFAAGSVLTMSGGATSHARFELAGTAQTLAGVANGGSGRGVIENRELAPANAGTSLLTLNGSGTYAFNGYLRNNNGTAGNGILGLSKSGAGTQTLAGINITYTGTTAVAAGVLALRDTTAFGSAATVATEGTLDLGKTVNGIGSRSRVAGPITGTGTINVNNASAGIGGGWVTFNGARAGLTNFTGTVNVNAGVLAMDNIAGAWSGNPKLHVAAGGLFAIRAQNISVDTLTGDGDVLNSWNGHGAAGDTLTVGATGGSCTFSGRIHGYVAAGGTDGGLEQGILNLTKAGAGALTLTGANSYAGATTINGGTLAIDGSGTLGRGTYGGAISLAAGTSVFDYRSSAEQVLGGALSGPGALIQRGPGTLTLAAANSFTGATAVEGGALKLRSLSPLTVPAPGAVLWLDAADAGTLFKDAGGMQPVTADGDVIALWQDKSGGNNHVTLSGTQTGPTYQAGVQSGQSVVRFSSAATCGLTTPVTVTGGDLTIFVVYSCRSASSTYRRAVGGSNNWLMGPYSLTYQTYNGGWVAGAPAVVQNQFVIHGVTIIGGGTLTAYVNGTAHGSRAGTYPGRLHLGVGGFGAEPLDGDIAELLVYTTQLTAAQRQGVETYLGRKWLAGSYGTAALAPGSVVSVASGATFGGFGTAGTVTVDAGGAVEGGQPDGGALTLGSLTFNGAGQLRGYLGAAAPIVVAGGVTASGGAGSIGITPLNLPANGTYPFLSYGSGSSPFGACKLASASRCLTLADNSSSNLVDIVVNASGCDIWTGALDGEWSAGTLAAPKNWVRDTGGETDFLMLDPVVFDDSAAGATAVGVNRGNVFPGSTTFNNAARPYSLSGTNGVMTGPLLKAGAGTLAISNANAFSRATLSNGTLVVTSNGALGGAPNSTLTLAGGTLQAGGAISLPNNVTVAGNVGLDGGTGSLTFAGETAFGSGTRSLAVNGNVACCGAVNGSAALTLTGSGALTLAGPNIAYSGATTLASGTLRLDSAVGFNSAVNIAAGANLVITNVNAAVDNWLYGVAGQGFTGAGTLTKDGVGWFLFQTTGIQDFQGAIVINNGILGNGMNNTVWNNGKVAVTVHSPGILDLRTDDMSIDRLSGNGTVANTYNTDVVNTLTIGGNNGSSAFSGVMRGVGGGANNSSLDAGKINLVKTGSGAFTLTGANLYKGTTTVNGGTLLVNGSHASGAGAYNVSAGTLGGTGTVWSVVNVTGPGTLAPGGTNVTGRFTIQNDVALGPGAIFDVDIKGTTPGQASGGYDQLTLAAGKTLSLGAGVARLVVRVPRAVALPLGQTFTLATGGTPNGYFEGLADGAEVRTGEYRFIIHYGPDAAITLTSSKMDKGTLLLVW